MTEREVLFTGIGGQGVQLASKTLAMAALAEGHQVLLLPRYAGGMRGGMTNATLTIGDGALDALPIVTSAWSAFVMDPAYWDTVRPNLAPGAVVVVNSSLFDVPVDVPEARVVEVPATELAGKIDSPMSAGLLLLGAFVTATGITRLDSVLDAMRQIVPPYRVQHVAANERAIEAGAGATVPLEARAWPETAVVR